MFDLTIGHLEAEPEPEQVELAHFADRHGLVHLPPDFTADTDLTEVPAGEPVIVRASPGAAPWRRAAPSTPTSRRGWPSTAGNPTS
ncbi:hypothetical protein OH786_06915 [Streptomyces atratus]|uniref:hypothetical protein n=1 Tax=Streptomyces atratus TaxID=1893 RepID=UPI000A61B803|nr:hypothetical protein [Streptomyces atratus]